MTLSPHHRPAGTPILNAPPLVLGLIGALVALHVLRIYLPGDMAERMIFDYALIPARYATSQAWASLAGGLSELGAPLVTYMFLHGDFTHLGLNSLWLLVFGPIVARHLGNLRFLLFFLFCGVAAALLHLVTYWGVEMAMIGASGGVSGLMAAGMRLVYARAAGVPGGLAPIFSRPILSFSLVWTIVNVVSGVLRIGVTDDLTLIAWVAHLGGYFAGLVAVGGFGGRPAERSDRRAA
jgi:membrane associated rhomboid family serine protease